MTNGHRFLLELTLDASHVSNFNPAYQVRVVAHPKHGETYERTVNFSRTGKGSALFSFSEAPGALTLAIRSEAATTSEVKNPKTIYVDAPASSWGTASEIKLHDVPLSDYYWNRWLHLTRNFGADRQSACAAGRPAFGSAITVYNGEGRW
jgi:hypothetical protein